MDLCVFILRLILKMIPKSISLRSFKCFSGSTFFEFPQNPGLFLIKGDNQVDPLLEGNGCGKSTLFGDAISWCFFGKTPRLLKAGDVLNWEAGSSGSVQFEFELNGTLYKLTRTQTPNSLSLSQDNLPSKTATQEQINALIGMDFDSMMASTIFAQFGRMFFDLQSSEKSNLLSSILELDTWDDAVSVAKKSVSQLESSLQSVLQQIARSEGQIEGLESRDFNEQITKWEERQQQEREKLVNSLDVESKDIEVYIKAAKSVNDKLLVLEDSLAEVVELHQSVDIERKDIEKRRSKQQKLIQEQQFLLKNLQKELEKFKSVTDLCPYCNQVVSKEHISNEISRLGKDILSVTTQIDQFKAVLTDIQVELTNSDEDLNEINAARNEFLSKQRVLLDKKAGLKSKFAEFKRFKQNTEDRINELENQTNPFVLEAKKQQKLINEIKLKIKNTDADRVSLEKELHATQYWVKGFSEVRLSLISDVLTQLELEVNNKLYQLGLQDWKISFAVEGLSKGGKIKKGFNVTISTPYNLEPVAWASWSGGESQRLRLAGALGLGDLITSKCASPPTFEIFDEPSLYLSEAGISSLLDILHDRARSQKKQIYLIDHRRLDATKFDGIITVIKTPEKIQIESNY